MKRISAAFALGLALAAAAQAETHYYRYSLSNRADQFLYRGELDPRSLPPSYVAVDRDSRGRVVKTMRKADGTFAGVHVYHYPGEGPYFDSRDDFNEKGREIGTARLTRDREGKIIRADNFDNGGKLTGHAESSYPPGECDTHVFNAEGTETSHHLYLYNLDDILTMERDYIAEGRYDETDYSVATGLILAARQFRRGILEVTRGSDYDAEGRLTRVTASNPDGRIFAETDYEHGLALKRTYWLADGTVGKELRYSYDDRNWLVRTELSFKREPVCTFSYERLSNGTVRKSIAKGLDGTVWAEYPDYLVKDIAPDGRPIGTTRVNLLKSGAWYGN